MTAPSHWPYIVGFSGRAGTGKDLAAKILNHYGYTRKAFADPFKRLLNERFGWTDLMWGDRGWKEEPNRLCGGRYARDGYQGFSPRSWAQWLGTEVGRETFGPDVWVDAALRDLNISEHYVFSDVRFPNEVTAIQDRGGVVIHLLRDAAPKVNEHISEGALSPSASDFVLYNNGTIEQLATQLCITLAPIQELSA